MCTIKKLKMHIYFLLVDATIEELLFWEVNVMWAQDQTALGFKSQGSCSPLKTWTHAHTRAHAHVHGCTAMETNWDPTIK